MAAETDSLYTKIVIVADLVILGVVVHYGWLVGPLYRRIDWLDAIHGRFCYLPIVVAAAWFGLRGGLIVAGLISILIAVGFLATLLTSIIGNGYTAFKQTYIQLDIAFSRAGALMRMW